MVEMKNYMETCVGDVLEDVLTTIRSCRCDNCKYDITAIVLNSLPPKYVVTPKGQIYTKLNALQQQFEVDITAAITKAAEIVRKRPRHED